MNQSDDAGGRAIDHAAEVDPLGFGVVACFAVVAFAGEHGHRIDRIPLRISAHAETAVVVLGELQRLVRRAGLSAGEIDHVREHAIERLLRHSDLPRFMEHLLAGARL